MAKKDVVGGAEIHEQMTRAFRLGFWGEYCTVSQPDNSKDMIGRPAGDEGPEDERDRLQSLFRPVLRLDLLLLLPPEPYQDVRDDGDANNDEPDSLSDLVDQVWPLCPR